MLAYGKPDAVDFSGACRIGVAQNHAFMDDNMRAACLSVGLVMALNGFRLTAARANATLTIMAVAVTDLDEAASASWTPANSEAR